MTTARRVVLTVLLGLVGAVLPLGLPAWSATGSTLGLSATPAPAGRPSSVQVVLDSAGPVAGAAVRVERRVGGAWTPVATLTTDAAGRAAVDVPLSRQPADNVLRAAYDGDAERSPALSPEVAAPLVRLASTLTLAGPASVVDETSAALQVTRVAADGQPVPGTVELQRRTRGGWERVEVLSTGADGRARTEVAPRDDTAYRLVAGDLDWVTATTSEVLALAVTPPGVPVRAPRGAPRPRITLPPQPHSVGQGAHAVITRIPDGVWRSMVGRSWHAGCPVGRAGLRLVRVNYWDFDGFRRRGEVVAAAGAAAQMAGALTAMHDARLPIRSMYRVDRFGWSARLGGADDYRSMAADNTSAFNCRGVVGNPRARSPHASGRSLDVNPWENPYRSRTGVVPDRWWLTRSDPRVAWRSREHAVVRAMAAHGLRWTYGLGDLHHFDAR